MDYTKPPLGLVPRYIRAQQRLEEIKDAVSRRMERNLEIPLEWIEEYNKLAASGDWRGESGVV
ncbi:hypothetical protein [Cohnella abietis]|uniref:Uncharacterized protein n=1 Tax=Cohnella abietis TaxID=2507935 RepID=A0A3T1D2L5_9BACL|nr:hypothetical protein [Cohnella abietis]BBI32357.1 hypothetical protein KCTCHS21_17560 [Cohnella abietis]